jgi:hypothetical protein
MLEISDRRRITYGAGTLDLPLTGVIEVDTTDGPEGDYDSGNGVPVATSKGVVCAHTNAWIIMIHIHASHIHDWQT